MFKKRGIKIAGITLVSVIVVLFILSFAVTFFINKKLPQIIAEKNDTPYNFTYKDVYFSVFTSSLSVKGIEISPKDSIKGQDLSSSIKEIDIVQINILKLLKKKEFSASKIKIIQPDIVLYPVEKDKKHKESKFHQSIDIDKIEIIDGNFQYIKQGETKPSIETKNINILFTGVNFNERMLDKKIPFFYNKFQFDIDSVYIKVSDYQYLFANDLKWSSDKLSLNNFKLKSKQTEGEKYLSNNLKVDLFDIEAPKIELVNTDWGFDAEDKLFFKVDDINFQQPIINILPSHEKEPIPTATLDDDVTSLINVKHLSIKEGKFKMWHPNGSRPRFSIEEVICDFEGIKMNELTRASDFPIDYNTFKINLKTLYYELNRDQYVKASDVNFTKDNFVLNNFKLKPLVSTNYFMRSPSISNVLLDIETPSLSLANNKWGFKDKQFFFSTDKIHIDEVGVKILAEKKNKPHKKAEEHMINFDINVNEINIDKSRITAKDKFDFSNFSIVFKGLFNDANKGITINSLLVKNPILKIFQQNKKAQPNQQTKKMFKSLFNVKQAKIENGTLELTAKGKNVPILKVKAFDLIFGNVNINEKTVNTWIPFSYATVLFKSAGIDYDLNKNYKMSTANLQYNNGNLAINQFKLIPKISRNAFVSNLKMQEDFYNVTVKNLKGSNVNFGLDNNRDFYINADQFTFNNLFANIFRSQIPPPNTKLKTMFSEKLRNLKFGLSVKNVKLVNSVLEYEEEDATNGTGKLTFSNINTTITNLNSGFKKSKLPNVIVNWDSDFMGADLTALWTFNPMDKTEKFNIKGSIKNMHAPNLDAFLVPYLKVSAQGNFNAINFDFTGDNFTAKGDFDIQYNNLKVSLLKKDGKKRKFLSAIGNVLISKNTKPDGKNVHIKEVKRNQQKSFFNFFLACILEGLKETILII